MERKQCNFRLLATYIYVACFAIYLFIGFQPVGAKNYEIIGRLNISSINLNTPVTSVQLEGKTLVAPDDIIGAYSVNPTKTLLIAHSTTAFSNLSDIRLDDEIYYKNQLYMVTNLETLPKSSVDMQKVLDTADKPTLVLMTCAGELLDHHDATHRLLVTAELSDKDVIIK